MYIYYFLSSFKSMRGILKKFKPVMTAIQIFQLVLILGQCFAAKFCGQNNLFYAMLANIVVLLFFFLDFYYRTYIRGGAKSKIQ
jgi:hypothetical protein